MSPVKGPAQRKADVALPLSPGEASRMVFLLPLSTVAAGIESRMRKSSKKTSRRRAVKLNGAAPSDHRIALRPSAAKDGVAEFSEWGSLVAVKIIQIAEIISRSASQVYEAGYGVRNSELRILLLLGAGEALSVNEISRRAGIDKAWISRSIDAMMKAGLTRRIPHPNDDRRALVSLTDRGLQRLRVITPIALTRDRHMLAGLERKEVHKVLDALRGRAELLLAPEPEPRPASAKRRAGPRGMRLPAGE
jgi:DNA-binding MarR family transcriptional regulator